MLMPATDRGRVLIIDDNDEIRTMLAGLVTRLGYAPIEARCGAAGLELAVSSAPDAVCLDLWTDDMRGGEVLDRLHRMRPELPVIIVTADPLSDMNRGPSARAAVDFIVRPFEVTQVRRALLAALTRR